MTTFISYNIVSLILYNANRTVTVAKAYTILKYCLFMREREKDSFMNAN